MSEHRPRFSRRRVLQIAGLAPLSGLASRSATAADGAMFRKYRRIHPKTMASLVTKSGLSDNSKKKLFMDVVEELWRFARAGADYEGLQFPEPNSETENDDNEASRDRLLFAYHAKNIEGKDCGDLIVARLDGWENLQELTDVCAFNLGANAAAAAKLKEEAMISDTSYQFGFTQTEFDMKKLMMRVRSAKGVEDKSEIKGGGC